MKTESQLRKELDEAIDRIPLNGLQKIVKKLSLDYPKIYNKILVDLMTDTVQTIYKTKNN